MSRSPGILMVAGEPSGDHHGADLARAVQAVVPDARFWGMGGEAMVRAGVELRVHMSEVSVVGFVEVLRHLTAVYRARKLLLKEVDKDPPSLGILIDFPDFNLLLARALKRKGIPLMYYIAPQVWAWRRGRMKVMARLLDRVAVILPFEEVFLRQAGITADYVGHPLVEQVRRQGTPREAGEKLGLDSEGSVLGILPGSRPREAEQILPIVLEGVRRAQQVAADIEPVVALSPLISRKWAEEGVRASGVGACVVQGQTHRVLRVSRVAIVASGTATLEAALIGTPMVVVYRASLISYLIGRLLVRVDYIALINILAGDRIVPELLQGNLNPTNVSNHILALWRDDAARHGMTRRFQQVGRSLGTGSASSRAAALAANMLDRT